MGCGTKHSTKILAPATTADVDDRPIALRTSPLSEVLWGKSDVESIEKARQVSAQCMRDRGWQGFSGHSIARALPTVEALAAMGSRKAYGVTFPDDPGPPDPNDAFVLQLTTAERQRFDKDLWFNSDPLGCAYRGHLAAVGSLALLDPRLREVESEITARQEADPRTAEIHKRWSACMATLGFQFERADDVWGELLVRLEQLPGYDAGMPLDGSLPGLAELQALEHQYYDADVECNKQTNRDNSLWEIRVEIEQAVLEENPELLLYDGE